MRNMKPRDYETGLKSLVIKWALKSRSICYALLPVFILYLLHEYRWLVHYTVFHLDILWKLLTYWIFRLITELFPVNFWQLPSQFLTRVLVKVRYKCCLEMKGASAPVIIGKLLTLELRFLCCGSHHQEGPFTLPLSPLHSVFVVSGGWQILNLVSSVTRKFGHVVFSSLYSRGRHT